jgi:hypothetical protein
MNYLKMRTEAAIPASATVDEILCRACGSSSGAAAAYCSTCGTPLLHDDLPVPHVGTRTLTGERLLAAYVIPGILITLFCWIPGLIGIALAIDAYGKLRRGDVEGADSAAWKARIALAIGAVIIGVSWLAPVAGRILDFLTSL